MIELYKNNRDKYEECYGHNKDVLEYTNGVLLTNTVVIFHILKCFFFFFFLKANK